jgi:putative DNA primase/helicase
MSAVVEITEASELAAWKRAAGDLFAFRKCEGYQPVALHLYRAANGSILYGRVRMHKQTADGGREKLIRPFWHDGTRWTHGEPKPDGGKALYGLHDVSAFSKALVLLCEGEQKADALTTIGAGRFVGVTSGSCTSAGAADWSPLAGRHVLIWPDHDESGAKYADEVTTKLEAIGCTLERLDVAAVSLPAKGDVMDWLEAFKATHDRMPTADDVLALPRIGAPSASDPKVWPDPQPLTVTNAPMEYPAESLPPCIRAAVEEVCGFVQAPLPLVASSAIAALSLAIQAHVDVKRAERLTGPVGLFMTTIADSGERKSTCDGFFTRAIREYESEQAEAYKPILKDYQADIAAWEAKYNGLKEKIKADAKARKPTTGPESELRDLEHDKPEPPKVPRLIYADVTPEALAFSLGKQWPSGGVVSAEAGIVFGSHGMGSDSVMRNLATLNQLWDGNTLTIDRRTSDSYTVRGARLTVALQVQEATIRSFFEKSGTLARGTGFLARFLIAWPQSTQGYRPFREAPEHWPHMATFNQRIAEILRQPVPMDDGGNLAPLMLTLSPEAKAAWIGFHDAVEAQLRAGGDLHDVRDVASKSADNAVRLGALFHIFSGATGPIGLDSFESAASIVAWHLSESKRFFSELAVPDDVMDAARLDAWMIEYCRTEPTQTVSKRTAQQFGPLRKADPLSAALKALEDMDRVRVARDGRQIVIHINPALLDGGAQ